MRDLTDFTTVFTTLGGLSGDAFWTAYHTDLTPYQQLLAQGELEFDFFCWSPGPDNWQTPVTITTAGPPPAAITGPVIDQVVIDQPIIPVVVVPPPWTVPIVPPPAAIPEPSTWLMLMLGAAAIAMAYRLKVRA